MKTFINAKIFTGDEMLHGHIVRVEEDTIIDVLATVSPTASQETIDLNGDYLVPAFADLQIYGGDGLLFGEHPSIDSLKATYAYALRGGACNILPTIATHSYEKIFEAIDAVNAYTKAGLPGVLGLHVEGPYINPIKRGAHAIEYIRKPTLNEVNRLIEKGRGIIRMITLAPEVCTDDVIQSLLHAGIIISAGHSNASYEEAACAFSKGISVATHLFNAMSPMQHRAAGLPGAIFNSSIVKSSIVADGHHVDFAAIRIAKKLMGERLFYITDAVTENHEGLYQHQRADDKYVLPDGTLSGSALTMLKAVRNGINQVGISLEESLRMASLYPYRVVGMADTFGMIRKHYKAELLWIDSALNLKGIYTRGELNRF